MKMNDRLNLAIVENAELKARITELEQQVATLSKRPEFKQSTVKNCTQVLVTGASANIEINENLCKCCTCNYQWVRGKSGSHSCAEYLKQELDITNSLLRERQKLLDAIPECEVHGKCVPHAIEWIESMIQVISENEQLESERLEMLTKFGELNQDKLRLDLLDAVNAEFNKKNGTIYGWAVHWNHNRISLHDSDPMNNPVRQAIDDFSSRIRKAGA
ncbi:hypothetical protein [Shewanella baltica]|uniref:hypothetical protein n=1 Tax=Shewanella baltica TaxID=62322 RepID=UPI00217D6B5B|nr:hypothetical protein [Shewanella baltica]MCS6204004.1 hypothetical protein [Shewanella baltica]